MGRLKKERTPISATTGFLWIVVLFLTLTFVAQLLLR
jgi:hypothetical protein